jgi:hypothetical protein
MVHIYGPKAADEGEVRGEEGEGGGGGPQADYVLGEEAANDYMGEPVLQKLREVVAYCTAQPGYLR